MATKAGVLKHIIQLAYSQAIWQFVETLAVTRINKSTHQAKENAVMTLVYINAIRITILLIMDGQNEQLFSIGFMNKMAEIKARIYLDEFKIGLSVVKLAIRFQNNLYHMIRLMRKCRILYKMSLFHY